MPDPRSDSQRPKHGDGNLDLVIELAKEYFPDVTLRTDRQGNWSGYGCKKARDMLGFTARYLLGDH